MVFTLVRVGPAALTTALIAMLLLAGLQALSLDRDPTPTQATAASSYDASMWALHEAAYTEDDNTVHAVLNALQEYQAVRGRPVTYQTTGLDGAPTPLTLDAALDLLDARQRETLDPHGHAEAAPAVPPAPDLASAIARLVLALDPDAHPIDPASLVTLSSLPKMVQAKTSALVDAFLAFHVADQEVTETHDLAAVVEARAHIIDVAQDLASALEGTTLSDKQSPFQVAPYLSLDFGPGANNYTKDFRFLLDVGGDDEYNNNAGGNGDRDLTCPLVRARAAAVLIDLAGDDRYGAGRGCGNNGGAILGSALLFDLRGNDHYHGGDLATNGGARNLGLGLLLDARGNDHYQAGSGGTNGGGAFNGHGALLETGGQDRFTAGDRATNGGGLQGGSGHLVDTNGHDVYMAGAHATNGGATQAGQGWLLDADGDDHYIAEDGGTNGGGNAAGRGTLIDVEGADSYEAGSRGTNGGGHGQGTGLLVDLGGWDSYDAGDHGTNGGATDLGIGVLYDRHGNDAFTAGSHGTNGGADGGGTGLLADASGDDVYTGTGDGTNGGGGTAPIDSGPLCDDAGYCPQAVPASALLVDFSGSDMYSEGDGLYSGPDKTVLPKGTVGAQLDLEPALAAL